MIRSNTPQVLRELDAQVKKLVDRHAASVRTAVGAVVNSAIDLSPVDTGFLKGNWTVGIGNEDSNTYGTKTSPRAPAAAKVALYSKLLSWNFADGDICLSNNTPYAAFPEYGLWRLTSKVPTAKVNASGYSRQAPRGMLRVSLTEFEKALRRELSKK